MRDDGVLTRFFDGLDEFPLVPWEVRVEFPLPTHAAELPDIAASLAEELGDIARMTSTSVLRQTGPTTWVLGTTTAKLPRLMVALEVLFRHLFDGPEGAIDITPINVPVVRATRHEPVLVGRPS